MINPESQNRTGPSGRACDLLPATVLAFLLALAALSAFPSPARAQADEPDEPAVKDSKSARSIASEAPARRYGREFADIALADAVDTRPRADYDPNGIIGGDLLYGTLRSVDRRTGARRGDSLSDSLTLLPTLGSKLGYTDNVLRRQSDRRSDELLEETPALKLRSEWDNHEFTADIGGAFGRYARNSGQNYDDLHAQVAARTEAARRIEAVLDDMGLAYCGTRHMDAASYYKLIVQVPKGRTADELGKLFAADSVILGGGVYTLPCHLQPVFAHVAYDADDVAVAEALCPWHICPPITSGTSAADTDLIIAALRKHLS